MLAPWKKSYGKPRQHINRQRRLPFGPRSQASLQKAQGPRMGGREAFRPSLLFNTQSRLVITFLPRSKRLLLSWLQSPSAVILEPTKNKV